MDFVAGSIITALTILFLYYFNNLKNHNIKKLRIIVSQSRAHNTLASNVILLPLRPPIKESQSIKFQQKTNIRILFTEHNAYWIKDNSVYCADLDNFGLIVEESTKVLDIISMDKVQLKEMMFIIEKLTEGKNDNWSTGN